MTYQVLAELAALVLLLWAYPRLRSRSATRRAPTMTISLGFALLPAIVLLGGDLDAGRLLLRGCAAAAPSPWKVAGLGLLLAANVTLVGSLLVQFWQAQRTRHRVAALPRVPSGDRDRLVHALPALAGVVLRIQAHPGALLFAMDGQEPTIVMSPWILEHLDDQELAAAMAHELVHLRHRDGLLLTWVHGLCPGGLGLGWLRASLAGLGQAMEHRADAGLGASSVARLAMASALVKVRRHAPPAGQLVVTRFAGQGSLVQARVGALLANQIEREREPWLDWAALLGLGFVALLLGGQGLGHLCHLAGR